MQYTSWGIKLSSTVLASALIIAASVSVPAPLLAQQAATPPDFTEIVRQKIPAVVAIMTRQMEEEQSQMFTDDSPLGEFFRQYRGGDPDGS